MHHHTQQRVVVGITGASGAIYSVRLLEVLIAAGYDVHLCISPSAQTIIKKELDLKVDLENFLPSSLLIGAAADGSDSKLEMLRSMAGITSEDSNVLSVREGEPGRIHYHHHADHSAPIGSGSFLTSGMVICPCSMSTLSAIAVASGDNLIRRAAAVHLKERRPLVLVPRETPLSVLQLDIMRRAAEAGAVMLPAMPGWYHGVKTLRDLIDFVVARICDQLGIRNTLIRRWGT
ncbi:MAG: 3-octaprenyl-4-hydroxybenzoate carboxy-lyase [Planctomycetes bacterium RBG_16_64_10]|nr:MAG: 3-octaprenyl-4-hydroxybenzoate carboxy-lyase [Planctomycetes bacterium RBG_16_64_10]